MLYIVVDNTAKQLRRCLNSIVAQLNDKVEVILINDGSTDNSISIIHDYIEHYDQLKLYDKHLRNCFAVLYTRIIIDKITFGF